MIKRAIAMSGVAILSMTLLNVAAAKTEAENVCAQAKIDAQKDENSEMWCIGGCCLGFTAVGAAYIVEPSPPETRLLGKSSEYVAYYKDCYRKETKRIRTRNAWKGFIVQAGVSALYILLVFTQIRF